MKIKFSSEVSNIITLSKEEAKRFNNENIMPEHLFLSLIKSNSKVTIDILIDLGADIKSLTETIENSIKRKNGSVAKKNKFSIKVEKILKVSYLEAKIFKSKQVESYHILTSILREDENEVTRQLNMIGINHKSISSAIEERIESKKIQQRQSTLSSREIILSIKIFLIKYLTKDKIKADRKIVEFMAKEIFIKGSTSDSFQNKLYAFLDECKVKKDKDEFIYLVEIVKNINLRKNY